MLENFRANFLKLITLKKQSSLVVLERSENQPESVDINVCFLLVVMYTCSLATTNQT